MNNLSKEHSNCRNADCICIRDVCLCLVFCVAVYQFRFFFSNLSFYEQLVYLPVGYSFILSLLNGSATILNEHK